MLHGPEKWKGKRGNLETDSRFLCACEKIFQGLLRILWKKMIWYDSLKKALNIKCKLCNNEVDYEVHCQDIPRTIVYVVYVVYVVDINNWY